MLNYRPLTNISKPFHLVEAAVRYASKMADIYCFVEDRPMPMPKDIEDSSRYGYDPGSCVEPCSIWTSQPGKDHSDFWKYYDTYIENWTNSHDEWGNL